MLCSSSNFTCEAADSCTAGLIRDVDGDLLEEDVLAPDDVDDEVPWGVVLILKFRTSFSRRRG